MRTSQTPSPAPITAPQTVPAPPAAQPPTSGPALPVDATTAATPPLPHERDQGATPATGAAGPGPVDPVVEQAYRDLKAGQVDTDLRASSGLDAQRRERLLKRGA